MASAHFDWIERVRILELENQRLMFCQDETLKDTNRKLLVYLTKLQNLRDQSKRMTKENDELRRLCCYLDEDREKLKETINEWKNFGCQAANFMQNEVSEYKEKLQLLEIRQNELLTENQFFQQLLANTSMVKILGEEALNKNHAVANASVHIRRDSGDGSSETELADLLHDSNKNGNDKNGKSALSSNRDEIEVKNVQLERGKWSSLPRYLTYKKNVATDPTTCVFQCIRSLESRLRKLEETKKLQTPQSQIMMQTSMSAPELEIVCRNAKEDSNDTLLFADDYQTLINENIDHANLNSFMTNTAKGNERITYDCTKNLQSIKLDVQDCKAKF